MKETIWTRKGRTIQTVGTDERKTFDSINLAKKESTKLQTYEGGVGAGSLVVIR